MKVLYFSLEAAMSPFLYLQDGFLQPRSVTHTQPNATRYLTLQLLKKKRRDQRSELL